MPETPATVRRPPRPVGAADPAARRMTPISAEDAESEAERLAFPEEPLPPITDAERKAARSQITLSTVVEHRGRQITITATDMTADQFCDLLDKRGFQAPTQAQEWQRLPDGTPICPKHRAPMRLRERQGDSWYSHNVGTKEAPVYCKGYHGKDSPGYDL
jgi:hypothetical protein